MCFSFGISMLGGCHADWEQLYSVIIGWSSVSGSLHDIHFSVVVVVVVAAAVIHLHGYM